MNEFRIKLGEDGRVLIPATCRKKLRLEPGEELMARVENGVLHLFSLKHALKEAQIQVQQYAKKQSLVEKLDKLRKEDKK